MSVDTTFTPNLQRSRASRVGYSGAEKACNGFTRGVAELEAAQTSKEQHPIDSWSSTIEEMQQLMAEYELIRLDRSKKLLSDAYLLVLKKHLGPVIRELEAGASFGERGIQGSATRTASVVAKACCEVLEVNLRALEEEMKQTIREKLSSKYKLLFKCFSEAANFEPEKLFNFQLSFTDHLVHKGCVIVDEAVPGQHPIILSKGECLVYKKITPMTVKCLEEARADINLQQMGLGGDRELAGKYRELISKLIEAVKPLAVGTTVCVGYIGPGEVFGLESQASSLGRSLFSYQASTSEVEYMRVNPTVVNRTLGEASKLMLHSACLNSLARRVEYLANLRVRKPLFSLHSNKEYEPYTREDRFLDKIKLREVQWSQSPGILLKSPGIARVEEVPVVITDKTYLTKQNLIRMFGKDVQLVDQRTKKSDTKAPTKNFQIAKPFFRLKQQIADIARQGRQSEPASEEKARPEPTDPKHLKRNRSSKLALAHSRQLSMENSQSLPLLKLQDLRSSKKTLPVSSDSSQVFITTSKNRFSSFLADKRVENKLSRMKKASRSANVSVNL